MVVPEGLVDVAMVVGAEELGVVVRAAHVLGANELVRGTELEGDGVAVVLCMLELEELELELITPESGGFKLYP